MLPYLSLQLSASPRWLLSWSLLVQVFSGGCSAQLDPVRNFCRRFGHQTAVIDRRLYIDGGLLNYNPISQYPTNYSNTGLFYQDLDVLGSSGMPELYANLSKNSSVPSVNGGTLWTDNVNKRFYLFGGEYYQQPPPPYFTLWSFDALSGSWDSLGQPAQAIINGVSYGAGVSISERGEGYYYGGWMSNNSIPGWSGPAVATSALVKYDMDTNAWTNSTGPDSTRRAEGAMVYIPISDGGMLVYFGGVQDRFVNGTVTGQPMEQIYVYDILSSRWYVQNATGAVPQMRRRFCAGATWAADQSSYNIYLYGGASIPPSPSPGFDDVYILTIPSFQWIKLYPSPSGSNQTTGQYPHHSLTCNVISSAQMLIIGGTFPAGGADCDAPDQFGTHNLDLGEQNPDRLPWRLFVPNLTAYAVPDPVLAVVGGSPAGGATATAPVDGGFSNPDLRVLMTRKASVASSRTPTRAVPSATGGSSGSSNGGAAGGEQGGISTGAIAGIAVGATMVVLAVLAGCYCLRLRRRADRNTTTTVGEPWSSQTPPATSLSYPDSLSLRYQFGNSERMATGSHGNNSNNRPSELEAPPPSGDFWHGTDGVTYGLLGGGGGGGGGSAAGGELRTKIDSEGRVWVQVGTGRSLISSSGSDGVVVSPLRGDIGGGGRTMSPASSRPPLPHEEPQELMSTEPRQRQRNILHSSGGGSSAGYGEAATATMSTTQGPPLRHETFYHP
ncbi:hypothetical protein B0T17DRAFT_590186 [Bombardia bombarda]|uniref:Kelch repeat-containing protein n=1 Tax=Bombardia bombarda TaxID=252184 RepID=A0AA39XBB6_9PEZI|nr:hypothetical protein B0T17DRAFT_590186 [Bombardia bombarda]